MKLLVIRHGRAEPYPPRGGSDADRPLTAAGTRELEAAGRIWASICPKPDVILVSPFLRARQTAQILEAAFGGSVRIEMERTLEPLGNPDELLLLHPEVDTMCVVGHMPCLGDLLGLLLAGDDHAGIPIHTGQGFWIELPGAPLTAGARLLATFDVRTAAALIHLLDSRGR